MTMIAKSVLLSKLSKISNDKLFYNMSSKAPKNIGTSGTQVTFII